MSKKVVVVNAGPRKGWNTDTMITEAAKGAEAAGAEIQRFDLFRLERYTGCISCFGCKKERFKGHCVCRDGLTPVLDAIREADGLIIGSPNYLSELTASFRAPRAIAFGGVPMGVPMPPMLAPSGMARAKAALPRSSSSKSLSTGAKMASIMAAVAVLLMNMENTAVMSMRPRSTNFGFLPKGFNSTRARFKSILYLVAAAAKKNPPKKSMMMGFAKVAMIDLWLIMVTPSTRKGDSEESDMVTIMSTMTSTDVDQIGNGCRIQKRAAMTKTPMTRISRGFRIPMGLAASNPRDS